MPHDFQIELLQAVNDWQRGSSSEAQRLRRAEALQVASRDLPPKFRECGLTCFRQIALKEGHLWELLADEDLAERVSSWTPDLGVARGHSHVDAEARTGRPELNDTLS
jgi:hypothetical protein